MVVRDVFVALASAALTTLLVLFATGQPPSVSLTTAGRPKVRGEKAFMLSVGLRFRDAASAASLLRAWTVAADYCMEHEPFLYAYEVAQSDKDNLSFVILERYRSKADYLGPHRRSEAFKAFRPTMREMQQQGAVVVSGESYQEMGVGFT